MDTRYKDNENGTITDSKTGLIWQAEHVGPMPWHEAMGYAKKLATVGHKDWRLPKVEELTSLLNYSKFDPASDFPGMLPDYFWSSVLHADDAGGAWLVTFASGLVVNGDKTYRHYVRCVRGGK